MTIQHNHNTAQDDTRRHKGGDQKKRNITTHPPQKKNTRQPINLTRQHRRKTQQMKQKKKHRKTQMKEEKERRKKDERKTRKTKDKNKQDKTGAGAGGTNTSEAWTGLQGRKHSSFCVVCVCFWGLLSVCLSACPPPFCPSLSVLHPRRQYGHDDTLLPSWMQDHSEWTSIHNVLPYGIHTVVGQPALPCLALSFCSLSPFFFP